VKEVYQAHSTSNILNGCKMDVVYIGKCTDNLQVNIFVPSFYGTEMPSFVYQT
jgi:hypothetical protein